MTGSPSGHSLRHRNVRGPRRRLGSARLATRELRPDRTARTVLPGSRCSRGPGSWSTGGHRSRPRVAGVLGVVSSAHSFPSAPSSSSTTVLAMRRASRPRADTRVDSGSSSHRPATESSPRPSFSWAGAAILSVRKQAHLPGSLARIQRGEPICVCSCHRVFGRAHRALEPSSAGGFTNEPTGSRTTLHVERAATS